MEGNKGKMYSPIFNERIQELGTFSEAHKMLKGMYELHHYQAISISGNDETDRNNLHLS